MKRLGLILLLFHLFVNYSSSQVFKGSVKNEAGEPVSYATVYIREASLGTISNEDGYFEIQLPAGKYVCVFQSLGYQTVVKQVDLSASSVTMHVILPTMVYDISGVVVSGKSEDPAYRIMRKVIAKAPEYANMVKSFNADVYIKGSMHIKAISRLVKYMAKDDLKEYNIKEGDTYLEESVNEIVFVAPDKITHKVKSVKSSFPDFGGNQSGSAMGFISGNIYKPDGFGAAYSPINAGAFKYYRFKYEGITRYDNYAVYKIAIIPIGKGSQYVQGTIFIVDGLWCVSNLSITKEEQMGVSLALNQTYNEVREGAWLPVTNRLKVEMDLMGNKGSFEYHTSIKYKTLEVNAPGKPKEIAAPAPDASPRKIAYHERTKAKINKKEETLSKLKEKENPTTAESYRIARLKQKQEELKIKDSLRFNHTYTQKYKMELDSNAKSRDTAFWNDIRPIPLTENELKSLAKHDSISMRIRKSGTKGDSLKKRSFNWGSLVLGGDVRKDSLNSIYFKGFLNPFNISFNVVDGLRYSTRFAIEKSFSANKNLALQPMIGYAFAREVFNAELLALYKDLSAKRESGFRVGSQSVDFNSDGIHPLESTVEALIFRENPARFYHSNYLDLYFNSELIHEFSVSTGLFLSDNKPLRNYSDYSFFFRDSKEYEPNVADNPLYRMDTHQDFSFELNLIYKPMPFYYIKDGVKKPYRRFNDGPEFTFTWRKGLPVGLFDTDYDLLKVRINQQKKLGLNNQLNYRVEGGYFINNRSMWFNEFQHFAKRPLIAGVKEFFPYFLLLDSYKFSTNEHFAMLHLQYKSPFIALKHLPVLRNRLWNESLFFSYLYSPRNKNYMEPGYGIGNIFYNVGVFAGFNGVKYQQVGFRLAITILGTKEISF